MAKGKRELVWESLRLDGVILSFPALFEPDTFGEQSNYKVDCLIKKSTETYKKLVSLATTVCMKNLDKSLQDVKSGGEKNFPIKPFDWEAVDREDLKDHILIRAKSSADKKRPAVVGPDRIPIKDETEIYGGIIANVYVSVGCYDNKYGQGLKFILQGVQKVKDGTPLGGGAGDPDAMFEVLDEEESNDILSEEKEDFEL